MKSSGFCQNVSKRDVGAFRAEIYQCYELYGRDFAWRKTSDPYHIVVSEIMLQQTQTQHVEGKYELFISEFPDFDSLAAASLHHILSIWQGLGYNRRAQALQKIARQVSCELSGQLPDEPAMLETFPGIGPATACSIAAFAFNKATIFIETNIRAVFLHHFFASEHNVLDKQISPLVKQTLDVDSPRIWYYALMDYGAMLKKRYGNPNKRSAHYMVQSKFEGSDRQIRGAIIRILTCVVFPKEQTALKMLSEDKCIRAAFSRSKHILAQMEKEGMVQRDKDHIFLPT
jgi:A/G-specific adenine glycosylase